MGSRKIKAIVNNYFTKGQYLTKFLTKQEQSELKNSLTEKIICNYDGGYEEAKLKRVFIGSNSNVMITKLKLTPKSNFYKLKHQTIKWYLMNMGIQTDLFGDIIECENYFIIVVCDEIVDILLNEVEQINRVNVSLEVYEGDVTVMKRDEETGYCSTLRLDNVIARCFKMSRNKAQNVIDAGVVTHNDKIVSKYTIVVNEEDVIKVRGIGKVDISSITQNIKTKRFIVKYFKYGKK